MSPGLAARQRGHSTSMSKHKVPNFAVQPGWKVILMDLGIRPSELLRKSAVPLDLFSRKNPSLPANDYFRLWSTLESLANDPLLPLAIIKRLSAEVFDPPLFSALCSPNLNTALCQIKKFKPLLGPMTLKVEATSIQTTSTLIFWDTGYQPPASLITTELAFCVQLARMATKERIIPLRVCSPLSLSHLKEYRDYFGVTPKTNNELSVTFSAQDANLPFVTENTQMWEFFEPGLRKRLSDFEAEETVSMRVKAALLDLLPSGQVSIDALAKRLNMSRRTLQRRLTEENTHFQGLLTQVRQELAQHYVKHSSLPYMHISFLLGYDDPNSFYRAFHQWTGVTPDSIRQSAEHHI